MGYILTAGIKTGGKDSAEKGGLMYLKNEIEQPPNMQLIKHQVNVNC